MLEFRDLNYLPNMYSESLLLGAPLLFILVLASQYESWPS